MLWSNRRESSNVVDRRGVSAGGVLGGGGLLVVFLYFLLGGDPSAVVGPENHRYAASPAQSDAQKQFVGVVLADTEDTWAQLFQQQGLVYQEPKLVLFSDRVRSACGSAVSAVGPFYCPADRQVYLDLNFFADLSERFGAQGDFARAYVIAHEVGHHVQTLLGRQPDGGDAAASVRTELQADCYAGVWAKNTDQQKHIMEQGDLDEALGAAAAVGDDRLQQQAQGYVVPDSFTHGSSAQRVAWFSKGYREGDMSACANGAVAH